jgi:outer membrane lipoprotein LolB
MHNKLCSTLLMLACAALLSACATSSGPRSSAPVAAYSEVIDLTGRLSVNYQKDGAPHTLSGKFNWAQTADAVNVDLQSFLGQTVATIRVTPSTATLTQGDGPARVAGDINTLTEQALGWSLPVEGLRDWLQGYASARDGERFVASPANNQVTTADGWRLNFESWHETGAQRPAPRRIDAERSGAAGANALSLRILIDPRN